MLSWVLLTRGLSFIAQRLERLAFLDLCYIWQISDYLLPECGQTVCYLRTVYLLTIMEKQVTVLFIFYIHQRINRFRISGKRIVTRRIAHAYPELNKLRIWKFSNILSLFTTAINIAYSGPASTVVLQLISYIFTSDMVAQSGSLNCTTKLHLWYTYSTLNGSSSLFIILH